MTEFLKNYEEIIVWFSAASIAGLMISLIVIPWVLIRLPSDYFVHEKRKTKKLFSHHPLLRGIFLVLKNVLGILLLGAGVIMLFIPGQGILTIIIGIILTDFPYKYKIERWIISRPHVLHTFNTLRIKAKQKPFKL